MGPLRRRAQDDQEADVRQLQAIKIELRRRMHDSIARTGAWLRQMLKGHLNYYAVPGNDPSLRCFVAGVSLALAENLKTTQPARVPSLGCGLHPVRLTPA